MLTGHCCGALADGSTQQTRDQLMEDVLKSGVRRREEEDLDDVGCQELFIAHLTRIPVSLKTTQKQKNKSQ